LFAIPRELQEMVLEDKAVGCVDEAQARIQSRRFPQYNLQDNRLYGSSAIRGGVVYQFHSVSLRRHKVE